MTEAGQSFLLDVRPALQRLRAATGRAVVQGARRSATQERVLALGTTTSIALLCLAPHLTAFRNTFPGVGLRISTSMELVNPGEAGLDCCLRYGAGHWPGVAVEHLAGEELFPICAPDFLPPNAEPMRVADLSDMALLHDLAPMSWVEWLAAFGAPAPLRANNDETSTPRKFTLEGVR